jgi:hypothetical protein
MRPSSWDRFHHRVTGVVAAACRPETAPVAPISITTPTESEVQMSERIETLKKARERMADDRDAFAKTLAAPFDRDKAERARLKFIETQAVIDAIDRAIAGEATRPAAAA